MLLLKVPEKQVSHKIWLSFFVLQTVISLCTEQKCYIFFPFVVVLYPPRSLCFFPPNVYVDVVMSVRKNIVSICNKGEISLIIYTIPESVKAGPLGKVFIFQARFQLALHSKSKFLLTRDVLSCRILPSLRWLWICSKICHKNMYFMTLGF